MTRTIQNLNQNQSTDALEEMFEQLSKVVQSAPLEQAEQQLNSQQQQTERNVQWLDEALGLLNSLSHADDGQQLTQLLENAENFVSKSSNDGYASHSPHLSKNN